MTEPVIDAEAIARLQRIGGAELVRQMIALFLEHGPDRIANAGRACAAGDPAGVEYAAHSLKSSAGNVGARRLALAAEAAEHAAEDGSLAPLKSMVEGMSMEYAAAAAALNGFLVELDQ